jgi:hypothetical protein
MRSRRTRKEGEDLLMCVGTTHKRRRGKVLRTRAFEEAAAKL